MDEKHPQTANLQPDDPAISPTPSATGLDETYNLYRKEDIQNVDQQEANRVLRKIDLHILPLLMTTYMLQYLDKSSINFASVFGLQKGTHLHGQQYSWLSSIFYLGYLVAQYPAGYALQRLPTGKFIGVSTIAWGVLIITTPACKNFARVGANRFLLGVTEAVVNPGFVLVMAMW
jgi:MFS family permease